MVALYPAIFTSAKNGTVYSVKLPDFPECDIIFEHTDYYWAYLETQGWLMGECAKKDFDMPQPSSICGIQAPKDGFVSLIFINP